MQRHVPGRWAMLAVFGRNPTAVDTEEMITVIVDSETNLQYARRLWIPAGSRRQSMLPIQIPSEIAYNQHQIDITSIHVRNATGGTEQFESNAIGMPSTSRSLLLSEEESRAAVIFDKIPPGDVAGDERVQDTARTINIARELTITSNRDSGLLYINDHFLPSSPVGLDAMDQIVIASDRILNDTLSRSRLQSWLQAGGQLWLMVDQVSPEAASALLGPDNCYSIVDRVELNDFELVADRELALSQTRQVETWSSEIPVDLMRVFVETEDIACSIDGWPAAFRKKVGSGEVLFTTLGARGWVTDNDKKPLLILQDIAQRFFSRRSPSPQPSAELASFVDDEIGYEIPGRSRVAAIFGLHLLVVVSAGIWLARKERLQYLAVVVPAASLIAAGVFIALGNKQTDAIPSTIAVSQIVRNLPDASEVKVRSVAAVYSQDAQPLNITSSPDSVSLLLDGLEDGEVKRILWDDSGKSKWMFVNQPPGVVRHVETESTIELAEPWVVRGTFTSRGFEGRLVGLNASRCEDAVIIAAPAPSLSVSLNQDSPDMLSGDNDNVLAVDQFINSSIVSDVQRDRQQLVRLMLASESPPFGVDPFMLVWTDPIDSGAMFDDNFARRGSALVSLPIELMPPPSGSRFQVPVTFVKTGTGSRGASVIFNARTGKWLEMSKPGDAEVRFMVPNVLVPCQLSQANVTIKLNAPSRSLEVKTLVDTKFVSLYRQQNPSGVLRFKINDPQTLWLDKDGGLTLSLSISESEEERLAAAVAKSKPSENKPIDADPSRSTWQIDYVHLDFEGTTL